MDRHRFAVVAVRVALVSVIAAGCTKAGETQTASMPQPTASSAVVIATARPVPRSSANMGTANADLQLRRGRFDGTDGQVGVIDIVVPDRKPAIRVVDVIRIRVSPSTQYRSYSLREVIAATHPSLAVTGAAGAGLTLPSALGLVVDSGKTVSALDSSSQFSTGIFCVHRDGTADIFRRQEYRPGSCTQAMQSGPLVVEPSGKNGIVDKSADLKRKAFERLVIGMDGQGSVHVVWSEKAHLSELADFMISTLKLTKALNLGTGVTHSAVWLDAPTGRFSAGNLDGGIPSAIVTAS